MSLLIFGVIAAVVLLLIIISVLGLALVARNIWRD